MKWFLVHFLTFAVMYTIMRLLFIPGASITDPAYLVIVTVAAALYAVVAVVVDIRKTGERDDRSS